MPCVPSVLVRVASHVYTHIRIVCTHACVPARGVCSASLFITNSTLGHGAAAALYLLGCCTQQLLAVGMTEKKKIDKFD